MQKSIAVLYKNSEFISKDKMKIKNYLIEVMNKELINHPNNKTVYETDNVKIYWVDTRIRNLNKLFRNNTIDVVISAENEEYWKLKNHKKETLFNEIKKEIDSAFKEITIYRVKYNWEEDGPSHEIIEEQILNCKAAIWGVYYETKEAALKALCENLEEEIKTRQQYIEHSERTIKKDLKLIEINNKYIKECKELLEE